MLKPWNKIVFLWNKLIGFKDAFSMENRLYNLVCIIALAILFLLLGNNLIIHLWLSALITSIVLILQITFYYYARFKKRFNKSILLNAAVSYVALCFNFFVNSGSNGPTLFIFFLTFHLLIAITPNKMHVVWMLLHIICVSALLVIERMHPKIVMYNYSGTNARMIDLAYTYIVSLVFIYAIVRHLKNYMQRQKEQTEADAMKLKAVFESSGSCHIFLDRNLNILYFNRSSAEFLHRMYKKNISNKSQIKEWLNPKYVSEFEKNFERALYGEAIKEERLLTYPNGEKIWWHISYIPVIDDNQKIIGVSFVASDITETKLQEENIRRKNESLLKIAHMQSHEIRHPVTNILGIMELIKTDGYKNTAQHLRLMEQAVVCLDNKIKEIVEQTNAAQKEI
jgi:PAS domain S-box-containing protein